jgi:DNA-binding MarR family transcriptional regulator
MSESHNSNDNAADRREEQAEGIMGLNRLIHEPSRLAIMTIIRRSGADYLFIRKLTGLSKGNLSNHLAKLEEAGLVTVEKHFEGKKPVTTVNLTEEGKETIETYWREMMKAADSSEESSEASPEAPGELFPREAYGAAGA